MKLTDKYLQRMEDQVSSVLTRRSKLHMIPPLPHDLLRAACERLLAVLNTRDLDMLSNARRLDGHYVVSAPEAGYISIRTRGSSCFTY